MSHLSSSLFFSHFTYNYHLSLSWDNRAKWSYFYFYYLWSALTAVQKTWIALIVSGLGVIGILKRQKKRSVWIHRRSQAKKRIWPLTQFKDVNLFSERWHSPDTNPALLHRWSIIHPSSDTTRPPNTKKDPLSTTTERFSHAITKPTSILRGVIVIEPTTTQSSVATTSSRQPTPSFVTEKTRLGIFTTEYPVLRASSTAKSSFRIHTTNSPVISTRSRPTTPSSTTEKTSGILTTKSALHRSSSRPTFASSTTAKSSIWFYTNNSAGVITRSRPTTPTSTTAKTSVGFHQCRAPAQQSWLLLKGPVSLMSPIILSKMKQTNLHGKALVTPVFIPDLIGGVRPPLLKVMR